MDDPDIPRYTGSNTYSVSRQSSLAQLSTTFEWSPEGVSANSAVLSRSTTTSSSPSIYGRPLYYMESPKSIKQEPESPYKIEEVDSDDEPDLGDIDGTQKSPKDEPERSESQPVKRGRGRPRKHPLPPAGAVPRPVKGRSKTGCLTCRRRKKKCGEEKPECGNCKKNGLICEGYPPKVLWQGGFDTTQFHALQRRQSKVSLVQTTKLPALIDGVESETDRKLLNHFVVHVSRVFTLYNEDTNPFKEILLPLAIENRGLMHALLCLAGSHLSQVDPSVRTAERYHYGEALKILKQVVEQHLDQEGPPVQDSSVAMTIVFCLHSICQGEIQGEYRAHLDAARYLVPMSNSRNAAFARFIYEFFTFHDVLNGVTSMDRRPLLMAENYTLPAFLLQGSVGALLGVLDGLFRHISRITMLRDQIRRQKARGISPTVDYGMLNLAVELDMEIRAWVPSQPPHSHQYTAAQLYRQVTWLYLYRTIQKSAPSDKIHQAVEEGLEYLRVLPQDDKTQSVLLMPLFLLGCAAFDPAQRPEITAGFDALMKYSGLGNVSPAKTVVVKVWELMDRGEETSWDWERIISDLGYDFLVT